MTLAIAAVALVSACYSPNQGRLAKTVQELVHTGMPTSTAEDQLSSHGFACSGQRPFTCSRIRQRVLPSSCVERVNLTPNDVTSAVDRVEIPAIACAGL